MRATIWKFTLPLPAAIVSVMMPEGAEPLFVAEQFGVPCVWAMVTDTAAPLVEHRFRWVGTGHSIEDTGPYIGSWLSAGGALVWHLFEAVR